MRRRIQPATLPTRSAVGVGTVLATVLLVASCTASTPPPAPWTPSQPTAATGAVVEPAPTGLGADDVTMDLLGRISLARYETRMAELSGELPVTIAGEETVIGTRATADMFADEPDARALDFLLETVAGLAPDAQVARDRYPYAHDDVELTAENVVVTVPGETLPAEKVLLTAHLDAWPGSPGADDNASGSAALLEALRLFQLYRFERTIEFIWFTGEEQGIQGSLAYAEDHPLDDVVAVVNIDMIAYDSDADRCAEINVGALPESQRIGEALIESIDRYDLELTYDYVIENPAFSDQVSFWRAGVGAVLLLQNFQDQADQSGCHGVDRNPAAHSRNDVMSNTDVGMALEITRLALVTVADMAGPMGARS